MSDVLLREGAAWTEWPLTDAQVAALRQAGFAEIRQGTRRGFWRLRSRQWVGAARIGPADDPVVVRIEPKLPIERLLFLVGYARRLSGWQDEEVAAQEWPGLLPATAHAFARAAERALRQGVLLGYRQAEESLTVVWGRIREADQMRRHYGLAVPVEVRYDNYTVDIAENRLLRAAAHRLLRLPRVALETRRLLRRLLIRLDGVSTADDQLEWAPTRLNARYHSALWLAELVLRGESYELEDGRKLKVDGLLLTMWKVFEDFLTVALAEAMRPYGGRVVWQDEAHHLDHARQVQLRPDFVYYDQDGWPGAVVDAKYKIMAGRDRADLYQMLAYCTVLGLRRGHLVYAAGPGEPYIHRVVGAAGLQIVETSLDLSVPPAQLRRQLDRLAQDIAGARNRRKRSLRARPPAAIAPRSPVADAGS